MKTVNDIPLKPYSLAELARFYGVCSRTCKKWIKKFPEVGKREGRYYSIAQVKRIFQRLQLPGHLRVEFDTQDTRLDLE